MYFGDSNKKEECKNSTLIPLAPEMTWALERTCVCVLTFHEKFYKHVQDKFLAKNVLTFE